MRKMKAKKVEHRRNLDEYSLKGETEVDEPEIKIELDDLIKNAEKQPGIADLMFVYGQYTEMLQKSREYLEE